MATSAYLMRRVPPTNAHRCWLMMIHSSGCRLRAALGMAPLKEGVDKDKPASAEDKRIQVCSPLTAWWLELN